MLQDLEVQSLENIPPRLGVLKLLHCSKGFNRFKRPGLAMMASLLCVHMQEQKQKQQRAVRLHQRRHSGSVPRGQAGHSLTDRLAGGLQIRPND